jgi:hypothetical protein
MWFRFRGKPLKYQRYQRPARYQSQSVPFTCPPCHGAPVSLCLLDVDPGRNSLQVPSDPIKAVQTRSTKSHVHVPTTHIYTRLYSISINTRAHLSYVRRVSGINST